MISALFFGLYLIAFFVIALYALTRVDVVWPSRKKSLPESRKERSAVQRNRSSSAGRLGGRYERGGTRDRDR
jgi:hypothetical protein